MKLQKLDRETKGLKLFPLFTLMGWLLVGFSIVVGVTLLSGTGAAYWGGNAKATRDAAQIGSALLAQLTTLAWWPKALLPIAVLGLASFMVGIAMEFHAIPGILDNRIELLKQAVPLMGQD